MPYFSFFFFLGGEGQSTPRCRRGALLVQHRVAAVRLRGVRYHRHRCFFTFALLMCCTHTHVMGVCKINRAWIQQTPPPDEAHAGSPLLYGDPPVSQGEEELSFHIAQPLRRCRTLVTLKAPAALLPALHKQAGAYRRAWSVLAAEQLQRCRATPGNDIKPFQGFPGRESRDVTHQMNSNTEIFEFHPPPPFPQRFNDRATVMSSKCEFPQGPFGGSGISNMSSIAGVLLGSGSFGGARGIDPASKCPRSQQSLGLHHTSHSQQLQPPATVSHVRPPNLSTNEPPTSSANSHFQTFSKCFLRSVFTLLAAEIHKERLMFNPGLVF